MVPVAAARPELDNENAIAFSSKIPSLERALAS